MSEEKEGNNQRAAALSAMQSLFSGLESRVVRQRMLPHPGEGTLYDLDPNRISRRSRLSGDLSPSQTGPFQRRESIGLLHKTLLGATTVKVCVVLDFTWEPGGNPFTPEALLETAGWALAPAREDIYFLIALAGMADEAGLSEETLEALSGGPNWRAGICEFRNPGWALTAPRDGVILPSMFDSLFDPEPLEQKVARVDAALRSAEELKEPGGFVLIGDVAKRVGVRTEVVTDRALLFAEQTPGIDVKDVGGELILKKDRFDSIRA